MTQAPLVQVAEPLAAEQTMPQPPQLLMSVCVLISQPSVFLLALQSAKPTVQAPLQIPPVQLWLAMWLVEQAEPQPPQLFGSAPVEISQPSVSLSALQSEKPVLHAPSQIPPAQSRVEMLFDEQLFVQLPHADGVVVMFVSQPSAGFMLQSPKPAVHMDTAQRPLMQMGEPLAVEQTMPQPPQLLMSLLVLISQPSVFLFPLQSANPVVQAPLQLPPAHVGVVMWLAEQTDPQPPQFAASVPVAVSQPSASLSALQSEKPVLQAPSQIPPAQSSVEMLFVEQLLAQLPHAVGVVVVFVSQPSTGFMLQSPKPVEHARMAHSPLLQMAEPLAAVQTMPQPPQLLMSFFVLISQPSDFLLALQSAKPAVQAPSQVPPVQLWLAMLLVEQAWPQPPQLLGSAPVDVSQPSVLRSELQSV